MRQVRQLTLADPDVSPAAARRRRRRPPAVARLTYGRRPAAWVPGSVTLPGDAFTIEQHAVEPRIDPLPDDAHIADVAGALGVAKAVRSAETTGAIPHKSASRGNTRTRGALTIQSAVPAAADKDAPVCDHPVMEMTLRVEIFPDDLDATADFYTEVLGFTITKDERAGPSAYVSLERGRVRIGAARRAVPGVPAARRPPAGAEFVFEVDDVAGERDRVAAAGWPLDEDLQDRPWGLTDFRIVDPAGYYLRITNRAR
jgi:lactoylglutathione lyase